MCDVLPGIKRSCNCLKCMLAKALRDLIYGLSLVLRSLAKVLALLSAVVYLLYSVIWLLYYLIERDLKEEYR